MQKKINKNTKSKLSFFIIHLLYFNNFISLSWGNFDQCLPLIKQFGLEFSDIVFYTDVIIINNFILNKKKKLFVTLK